MANSTYIVYIGTVKTSMIIFTINGLQLSSELT